METYTTLDGQVLDLSGLTETEREHLRRCYDAYQQGEGWEQFSMLVYGRANPLVAASGGRVTRTVWEHPLFQAIHDLADRLGIKQGEVAAEPGDDPDLDPLQDSWLSAPEAARSKGVSLVSIHAAIKRGELVARPTKPEARRLMVSANSLRRWTPDPVRQRAGRIRAGTAA